MAQDYVIFDFDGVLIDSHNETRLTAYNTATDSLLTSLGELPTDYEDKFNYSRWLARTAGEMTLLAQICADGGEIPSSRVDFESLIEAVDIQELKRKFFRTRNRLVEHDREAWLTMNQPFRTLWAAAMRIPQEQMFIVTHKNRDAVVALCEYHGMANVVEGQILSGDMMPNKEASISKVINRIGEHGTLHFIDDALKNLLELQKPFPELDLHLATWGYNNEKIHQEAANAGINLLSEEEAATLVQNSL